jgi:hypothetical protein
MNCKPHLVGHWRFSFCMSLLGGKTTATRRTAFSWFLSLRVLLIHVHGALGTEGCFAISFIVHGPSIIVVETGYGLYHTLFAYAFYPVGYRVYLATALAG